MLDLQIQICISKLRPPRDSNHSRLNDDLGKPDDPATIELYQFLDPLVGPS